MAELKKKEEVEYFFSKEEYDKLRAGMKAFPQKRIKGKLQAPFLQYLESIGVVSFQESGYFSIINPFQYARNNQAYANIQSADEADTQEWFNHHPEDRKKYEVKISTLIKEVRETVFSKSLAAQA